MVPGRPRATCRTAFTLRCRCADVSDREATLANRWTRRRERAMTRRRLIAGARQRCFDYGSSRAKSESEARWSPTCQDEVCRHRSSEERRKRQCRADARPAVVTPALQAQACRGLVADRRSAMLSAPSAVIGAEAGALARETRSAPATRTPASQMARACSREHRQPRGSLASPSAWLFDPGPDCVGLRPRGRQSNPVG